MTVVQQSRRDSVISPRRGGHTFHVHDDREVVEQFDFEFHLLNLVAALQAVFRLNGGIFAVPVVLHAQQRYRSKRAV